MVKKRNIKIIVLLLIVLVVAVLPVCKLVSELSVPLKSEITLRDSFIISLDIDDLFYRKAEADNSEPFDFKVTVEYIGGENEIEIWHTSSVSMIEILDENGKAVVETVMDQPLCSTTIKPGEKVTEVFTGKGYDSYFEFEGGGFERGVYTVRAFVNFSLDEELTNEISCTLELPLIII